MLNQVETALRNSVFADNQEIDQYLERMNAYAFAASNNLEIDLTNTEAEADAAIVQGEREIKIGEYNDAGVALAGSYISLGNLVSGTNAPQPTATTVDTVYHNGTTRTRRTGVNLGTSEWTIEGYDTDPAIALLIAHTPGDKATPSGKEGKPLAYLSYNLDRSFYGGKLTITGGYSRGTDTSAWVFSVVFDQGVLYPSSQNPVAGENTVVASGFTPTSGPVGTVVTVRGTNMDNVASIRLGATDVGALTGQTTVQVQFTVPVGATAGDRAVTLIDGGGEEIPAGVFEVTV